MAENDSDEKPKWVGKKPVMPANLGGYSNPLDELMENCIVKSVFSSIMGLGAAFGIFMSSVSFTPPEEPLPFKQAVIDGFKQTGRASISSAKNFAIMGAVFAGSECAIEQVRAKSDKYNGIAAGCFTGGVLAWRTGPQGMALGCVGFAAFSFVFDKFLLGRYDESYNVTHDDKFSSISSDDSIHDDK